MKATMVLASLALMGNLFSPQAGEGQYPFLDPDDPCFEILTGIAGIWIPSDQAAAWSNQERLGLYLWALRQATTDHARLMANFKPLEGWTAEDEERETRRLNAQRDCVPVLVALGRRVDERLQELGVDFVVDASRNHVKREQATKEMLDAAAKLREELERALKSIGGRTGTR